MRILITENLEVQLTLTLTFEVNFDLQEMPLILNISAHECFIMSQWVEI